jgi:hypothetical protein
VVFGAHYSKGNQAGKDAIDRIGGSGVFARDPDVILTMTSHEDKDAYVVDLTLRALPHVDPFVVRWQHPCFMRDAAADASRVKQPGKAAKDAPPKVTYRRGGKGSLAGVYGPLLEHMPPLSNEMPRETSEVLNHIAATVRQTGEDCDVDKAQRIFDNLRQKYYSLIIFKNGLWQGCLHDEGGAS